MTRDDLLGVWTLDWLEFRRSDGAVVEPVGSGARGLLVYTKDGRVAGQLMRPSRPAFSSGDQLAGSDAEVRAAFEGYVAYWGTWELDEGPGVVRQSIEGSLYPNWIGTVQTRFTRIEKGRLFHSTPAVPVGGLVLTALAVWERPSP